MRIVSTSARVESGGFAGLIFALHPIHVEAVAWVSGVTEPLLAVCLLGSFWSHLRSLEGGADSGRWRAFSLLAYALALLSKETRWCCRCC